MLEKEFENPLTLVGRNSIQMILQHINKIIKKFLHPIELEEEQNRTEIEYDLVSDKKLGLEDSLDVFN